MAFKRLSVWFVLVTIYWMIIRTDAYCGDEWCDTNTKLEVKGRFDCSVTTDCTNSSHNVCVNQYCYCEPNYKYNIKKKGCYRYYCNEKFQSTDCYPNHDFHRHCSYDSCDCEYGYKEGNYNYDGLKCIWNSYTPNDYYGNGISIWYWVWIFIVIPILFAISIGLCVRRRRRMLLNRQQAIVIHQQSQYMTSSNAVPIAHYMTNNTSTGLSTPVYDPPPAYVHTTVTGAPVYGSTITPSAPMYANLTVTGPLRYQQQQQQQPLPQQQRW
ncbi:uncharacterized protein LOC128958440 [Oppia nitens]|uniref:uncharacterized protein LOC128958440 n=1 Tax=Oppia nitens TaxID=1686743 RepID=UPI0023DC5C6B|nr:uncharacterized protein LOC128958440 [Oppia nitens]